MSLEKSTPYRNAWYRDLLEKEAELKQYTDEKVAQAIELPEVTSEDNGDLLAADDGSWTKSDKLKTIMNAGIDEVGKIPIVGAQGTWGLTDYPSKDVIVFTCSGSTPTLENGKTVADLVTAFNVGYLVIVKWLDTDYIMTRNENGTAMLLSANIIGGARSINYLVGSSGVGVTTLSQHTALCLIPPNAPNKTIVSTSDRWVQGDFPTEIAIYHCTGNISDGGTLTLTETLGDIIEAVDSGKLPVIIHSTGYIFYFIEKSSERYVFEGVRNANVDSKNTPIFIKLRTDTLPNTSSHTLLSNLAYSLPSVSSADNGKVPIVANGGWTWGAPESPIAVFSVTFKSPNIQMEMYEHVYWGANDTTHEIVEGVTDYCAELDAAMAEGKAIMIKAYVDDKMFNLVPTSLTYMAGRYTLINNLGQGTGIYYSGLNGAWERFKYSKTASSDKDGSFTADIKLSLT